MGAPKTTGTNNNVIEPLLANNEVRVRPNIAINRLVDNSLNMLTEHSNIAVLAKGIAISRAITVIEIIKRRLDDTLHQYNQLGKMMASNDEWNFIDENESDRIESDSILPAIIIHLSSTRMPELETTTTYQPPSARHEINHTVHST